MIHWTKLSVLRGTFRIASFLTRTLLLVDSPTVVIGIETAESILGDRIFVCSRFSLKKSTCGHSATVHWLLSLFNVNRTGWVKFSLSASIACFCNFTLYWKRLGDHAWANFDIWGDKAFDELKQSFAGLACLLNKPLRPAIYSLNSGYALTWNGKTNHFEFETMRKWLLVFHWRNTFLGYDRNRCPALAMEMPVTPVKDGSAAQVRPHFGEGYR